MALFQVITRICLLANALWISLAESQVEPKETWTQYGEYSYLFIHPTYNLRYTWYQAEKLCRENESLLVSIHSKEENKFLFSQIAQPSPKVYWIGLSSLNLWDDYQWSDLTRREYENWDGKSSHEDRLRREKCVKIDSAFAKWQDANCGEGAGVICKKVIGKKQVLPPLPTLPPNGYCPSGWHQYDKKCYKIYEEEANWTTAKTACRAIATNVDLVSIHSKAENMFLTSMLVNDTWIGGQSLKNEPRQGWSDNSPLDYSELHEDTLIWENKCVQILADEYKAGTWETVSCFEERMYLCQRHIDPLIPIPPTVVPPKCDNKKYELVGYRNDCYLSLKNKANSWLEAEKFCEDIGSHLTSIGSVYENAFIYSYLYPLSNDVWIGLLSEGGLYKWLNTWPLNYTNWMIGHPRNPPINQTLCVVLDSETLRWKTEDCENKREFLCRLSDDEPTEIEEFDGICPSNVKDGLDLGGRYCFSVYGRENKANWSSAADTCLKYNSQLASFHSEQELRNLGSHLKDLNEVWIGLHQIHDGTYEWLDESVLDFVYWEQGVVPDDECVAVGLPGLFWKGDSCSSQKPFICSTPKVLRTKNDDGKKPGSSGLSAGGVAGIVIAVLILVSGLAFLAYYKCLRTNRRRF